MAEHWRAVLETAPVGIAVFDHDMRYLEASAQWKRDYLNAEAEFIGRCHYDLFPQLPPHLRDAHRRGFAGETLRGGPEPFTRPDGHVEWVRWEIRPWHEASGEIGGIMVFSEVLTQHMLTMDALRTSEESFRSLFRHMPDAYTLREIIVDAEGRPADCWILAANPAYLASVGLSEAEVVGRRMSEILPGYEEDTVDWLGLFGEVALDGRSVRREGWSQARNKWLEVTGYATGNGRFVFILTDITERKTAEERVRRLSSLYAALSQCNQAIVHCRTEAELFAPVCRSAVEFGGMRQAWIGFLDETGTRLRPVACYGGKEDCLETLAHRLDDPEVREVCPSLLAIRENRPVWCQNLENDPRFSYCRAKSSHPAARSLAALPLRRRGRAVGSLTLYSDVADAFDEEAQGLLLEMATDIGFALDNFDREAERQHAVEALRASELRYRIVFQTSLDAVNINRLSDGLYIDVNNGFLAIIGYSRDELVGHSSIDLGIWVDPADRDAMVAAVKRNGSCRDHEARFRRKDGGIRWGLMSASLIMLDGEPCVLSVTRDITDLKRAEMEIRSLAYYDPLTRLPNRRMLNERLRQGHTALPTRRYVRALLFVDLDNFKTLNDTLGHEVGDQLLQEVARRLTDCVREVDTVARLGGDDFVVLLEGVGEDIASAEAHAGGVANKILVAIDAPFGLAGRDWRITASIGITLFDRMHANFGEILKQSDIAMYQAKAAGRNAVRFFAPDLQVEIDSRAILEDDLRRGFAANQFVLHYQPQVDHRGVIGAEALIRWNHPRRGLVSPDAFIPVAEETGLIRQLGGWVLKTACAQLAVWAKRRETRNLVLAVNVSARQFHQSDFVATVLNALADADASPRRLKLEITESLLLDNLDDAVVKMTALKNVGVAIALDDFGTGYSSLAYLKYLPLDQLKIDRTFVADAPQNTVDGAIAQTIITLGKAMGLSVIAEGVETEAQRDFLALLGCEAFQGYLFGRPVPIAAFEAQLAETSRV